MMTSAAVAHEGPPHSSHRNGVGRFRPRARLLKSLGEELISSETVAILELVRNCYDADATRVEIRFLKHASVEEDAIEIWDNGYGMTEEILLGPWLEPATDHKATGSRTSTGGDTSPGGRRRLGSKGVGRFATQRLGRELILRSRAHGSDSEIKAYFDWNQLETADSYLDQLQVPWSREPATHFQEHGTSLLIQRLRDDWNEERFERLRVGLARLVSPSLAGEKFSIYMVREGIAQPIRPALDQQHAMYSLEGTVDENGVGHFTYQDMLGANEDWERSLPWHPDHPTCGPFRFRINAWDLDREPLEKFLEFNRSKLKSREFRKVLREHSGISLYRDGFRILPYGEPDNDWLRLDRRRVNNPTQRFSNNQILGWIHLSARANPGLCDQTNREGLVVNEPFQHLQQVVSEILDYLEARRFTARRGLTSQNQKRSTVLPELTTKADRDIDKLLKDMEAGSGSSVKSQASQIRALLETRREAVAGAVQHYSSLATSGLMSSLVFGQLQHPLQRLRSEVRLMQTDLDEEEPGPETVEDLRERLNQSLKLIDDLQRRLQKMDPFVVSRQNRKPQTVVLEACVRDVLDVYSERLLAARVDWHIEDPERVSWETRPDVLQQALANILDNAVYWLEQRQTPRLLTIKLSRDSLVMENNGPLVPPSSLPEIFEPHFTMKPEGAGLGLTIARDLLMSIDVLVFARNVEGGVAMVLERRKD